VIAVTAAGGPTGTAVVRALWSRGEQVRAMVGTGRPHPELTARIADLLSSRLGRRVTAVDAVPDGPVPPRTFAEHLQRLGAELESVGPAAAGETR
jgi:uncharacterized protein YbjT (DUF2867 family)